MSARLERVRRVVGALRAEYAETPTLLVHRNAFELLISVILSAQTTDAQVNSVTGKLFAEFPDARSLAAAELSRIEAIIHSVGFYRVKARNIRAAAGELEARFGGVVPREIEQLITLPGVGRKSANVVVGHIWGEPAIIVDTHFMRVTRRLDLVDATDPTRIEFELKAWVPVEIQYEFSMLVNFHGRRYCTARKPTCADCPIRAICPWPEKPAGA